VDGEVVGRIEAGVVVLLGVGEADDEADADFLAGKVARMRIMEDEAGKMNLSLADTGGAAFVVSQFTLYGDVRKGLRPSFTRAAPPDRGRALYEHFARRLADEGVPVETGLFGAMMEVDLLNWGPVTILLDTEKNF